MTKHWSWCFRSKTWRSWQCSLSHRQELILVARTLAKEAIIVSKNSNILTETFFPFWKKKNSLSHSKLFHLPCHICHMISHWCWEHGWRGSSKFWRGGGTWVNIWESMRMVKTVLKNTCEGIHLLVKFLAIRQQVCKFTKDELFHTHFSSILFS